jgi:RNA polymerase sigma-70 factor (ECF subfamily)
VASPRGRLAREGILRPWLLKVARNIVIDHARASKARPHEVGEQALTTASVDDDIEAVLLAQDVSGALASLSTQHREVLVQTYYLGRSVAEAAAALSVPAGTVKSRTYYALRALRLAFEERGIHS